MTPEQEERLVAALENFPFFTLEHDHGELVKVHQRIADALESINYALENVAKSIRAR